MHINELNKKVHDLAVEKGWWESGDRNMGEMLALIHSEVSEALEEWRVGRMETTVDEKGKPHGFWNELADVYIRLGDICARYNIDIEKEIDLKHKFNKTRPYRHGGKLA